MAKKKKKQLTIKSEETTTVFGSITIILSLILLASVFIQNTYFFKIKELFGIGLLFASMILFITALRLFGNSFRFNKGSSIIFLSLFLLSFLALNNVNGNLYGNSGKIGEYIGNESIKYIQNRYLDSFLLFCITIFFGIIGFSIPILKVFKYIKLFINFIWKVLSSLFLIISKACKYISNLTMNIFDRKPNEKINKDNLKNGKGNKNDSTEDNPKNFSIGDIFQNGQEATTPQLEFVGDLSGTNKLPVKDNVQTNISFEKLTPKQSLLSDSEFDDWKLPPITLLDEPVIFNQNTENVRKNSETIERTLESFGILSKVSDVKVGPTVTQYALQITMGTKAQKISNLSKDIALALAAPGEIRIEVPIPGTSLIGIEIPNTNPKLVKIREIIETPDIAKAGINLAIGRDISGGVIVKDLRKMPHLLIAGATGSGKSSAINAFLVSMLMRHTPNELRLILVDPKQVELSQYNGIGHLLTPVITDMDQVVSAIKWLVQEMVNRYTTLKQSGARNIESYNSIDTNLKLPYIGLIIDEMADLMFTKGKEVESLIVRLAQMSRAVGIHLLLATQRPSVDVITGLIKANIPARIGMGVTSQIESRVILDQTGAETLLGKGDMLLKLPDMARVIRVQSPFVDDKEIERITLFLKESNDDVEYVPDITEFGTGEGEGKTGVNNGGGMSGWEDEYFPEAVRLVCQQGKASASMLQTVLKIGYNRAARLINEMQEKNVLGEVDRNKMRKVLVSDPESFLSELKNNGNNNSDENSR